MWKTYDLNGDGTLDMHEARLFIKDTLGALKARNQSIDSFANNVFVQIDQDRSGAISKYEMTLYLKQILEKR